VLKVCI